MDPCRGILEKCHGGTFSYWHVSGFTLQGHLTDENSLLWLDRRCLDRRMIFPPLFLKQRHKYVWGSLLSFTTFSGNTCKLQSYFVEQLNSFVVWGGGRGITPRDIQQSSHYWLPTGDLWTLTCRVQDLGRAGKQQSTNTIPLLLLRLDKSSALTASFIENTCPLLLFVCLFFCHLYLYICCTFPPQTLNTVATSASVRIPNKLGINFKDNLLSCRQVF